MRSMPWCEKVNNVVSYGCPMSCQHCTSVGDDAQVRLEVKLSSSKLFYDQHDCRAAGTTWQGRCFGALCSCKCAERLAAALERSTASSVGEEAEVADADQAGGQDMKQEPAEELVG